MSNVSGAIDVVNAYSEISPVGVYYYMEENWGEGPDLYPNLPCLSLCEGGRLFGESVTGMDSANKKKDKDNKVENAWMYDDSPIMEFLNLIPGAQAWSKSHDYYLDKEKNKLQPFGDHTQLTIIPFLVLGTYGGIYGSFAKPINWSIEQINELRGKQ